MSSAQQPTIFDFMQSKPKSDTDVSVSVIIAIIAGRFHAPAGSVTPD